MLSQTVHKKHQPPPKKKKKENQPNKQQQKMALQMVFPLNTTAMPQLDFPCHMTTVIQRDYVITSRRITVVVWIRGKSTLILVRYLYCGYERTDV